MLCLLDAPSKLDQAQYPGAKNRYDDFVVIHMNQTMSIHGTVSRQASNCAGESKVRTMN